MNDETSRRELQRRLSIILTNGHATGFDMGNIREVLTNAQDAATRRTWSDDEWDELAQAIERISTTPTASRRVDGGALATTQADGQPLSQQYLDDAACIIRNGQKITAEMERLRVLVEAAMLVLRVDEQDVMELVAASIEALQVFDCGDDPAQGLDDVCPSCRLKSALRRMSERRGQP